MSYPDRKSLALRVLAVVLCVSIVVFFCALLMHHHGVSGHAENCQICTLGHTTASIASVVSLIVIMQMLMVLLVSAPSRGSPSLVAVPTTRPPPTCL
jgi:ABC-type Co2+ transport system permease subunit